MRNAYRFLLQSLMGIHHAGDLHLDGRMILKWILKELGQRV
jgi:hypothetical protein